MRGLAFNRMTAWLGIVLLWAVLFLPGLGRQEVQSNEPKRMLPAEQMLIGGDWLTPEFCGEKYYKKPPLINWMIAVSYRVCGISEFAARLPSVLMTLLAVSVIILLESSWFALPARFCTAIGYLTTYAVIESGRLAEIEATLMSLTALAAVWWLSTWLDRRSPWLIWPVSGLLLGAGLLLKGPIILMFFYVMVLAGAYFTRRWKALLHPAHFVGLLTMAGLFLAWAYPALQVHAAAATAPTLPQSEAADTWITELLQQVNLKEIAYGNWLKQIGFAVGGFLPWLPLLLLARKFRPAEESGRLALRITLAVLAIDFLLFNLMPGTRARYSAPLSFYLALAIGLLATSPGVLEAWEKWRGPSARILRWFFVAAAGLAVLGWIGLLHGWNEVIFHRLGVAPTMPLTPPFPWSVVALFLIALLGYQLSGRLLRGPLPMRGVMLTAAVAVAAVTMFYGILVLPVVDQFAIKRPAMQTINPAAASPAPICVYRNSQPFLFYLRRPFYCVMSTAQIPDTVRYIFLEEKQVPEIQPRLRELGRTAQPAATTMYKKDRFLLLQVR